MIKVGERAPDAQVFPKPGKPVSLSELRGNGPSVLLFFPMAFSSTCTEEMCAVADNFAAWNSVGNVIGLSVDSPYVNAAFAESVNAEFPIVSDFNREATKAYGIERDLGALKSVSERAAFVIDGDGIVRYTWIGENPGVFPPMDEIRAEMEKLQ